LIDQIAKNHGIPLKKPFLKRFFIGKGYFRGKAFFVVKPHTYMNCSGEILDSLLRYTGGGIDDIVVVCDTLDLEPGYCRLKRGGSSAGHRGLSSILRYAEKYNANFLRLFIGIGRPYSAEKVISYVLGKPKKKEQSLLDLALEKAEKGLLELLSEPPERVMNAINAKKVS
jgi:PTH1 family peptidyl-tRNA hydrolase